MSDPFPRVPPGRSIMVNKLDDGRWLALWVTKWKKRVEVLTLGTGATQAEAMADLRNDIAQNWPESDWPTTMRTPPTPPEPSAPDDSTTARE